MPACSSSCSIETNKNKGRSINVDNKVFNEMFLPETSYEPRLIISVIYLTKLTF
jgi:hypothetical protein